MGHFKVIDGSEAGGDLVACVASINWKGAEGGLGVQENRGAPLAFLLSLKLPFPSISNACHQASDLVLICFDANFPALLCKSSCSYAN